MEVTGAEKYLFLQLRKKNLCCEDRIRRYLEIEYSLWVLILTNMVDEEESRKYSPKDKMNLSFPR